MTELLKITNVAGGYKEENVLDGISFEVQKGELFGVLGPNGSGKTTLLKMISGVMPFEQGEIMIKGKDINKYTAKELAKSIAVLPQHSAQAFSYTVKETVSLGRYAHQRGWLQSFSPRDEEMVKTAMEQTGISSFEDHHLHELSGGERQRVFLAQALAQEPQILLLDEPTNHLDLSFQKELLDQLKQWSRERQLTVVSIFHDLNLAGLFCDRLLLLENGRINRIGTPIEVLKQERIESVFHTSIEKLAHPTVPKPQMVLLPEELPRSEKNIQINEQNLKVTGQFIKLQTPILLKTLSSGVTGSGFGWHHTFINRHVDHSYDCTDHASEMKEYLKANGFTPEETVGMMTAVNLQDAAYRFYEEDGIEAFIVVTAGTGNAVDATSSRRTSYKPTPGTINAWVFAGGLLSETAFVQSMITATEAKVKALFDLGVKDPVTATLATGTSTDSLLIAASQRGKSIQYAGPITPLGNLISKGIYECVTKSLEKYKRRYQV
ncbi:adenosylcobinamide amidohydrolase [Peribacillus glennii]|uniref:ATP-binding cassette domain-containing protein n=1 Tax=Peribacillus glennii TaxID=2303991 RepID=A0A372LAR3_9BACI|nr:adenosylcobinamide amidohydrolase [Peribacillus glennii]RFU62401.1 ATP-binding cassette domain-containing protein [Peribacillus glennii]